MRHIENFWTNRAKMWCRLSKFERAFQFILVFCIINNHFFIIKLINSPTAFAIQEVQTQYVFSILETFISRLEFFYRTLIIYSSSSRFIKRPWECRKFLPRRQQNIFIRDKILNLVEETPRFPTTYQFI